MVVFISWVIARSVKVRTGIETVICLLLLAMMVAMLVGPVYLYLTTLGLTLGDVAIWEIAVFMSVGMMPIGVLLFAQFWIQGDTERKGPLPLTGILGHVSGLRAAYILFLLLSELLMGWAFNLVSGLVVLSEGYTLGDVGRDLSYSVTTYWFVFTMVGEMGLTLLALRRAMRRDLLVLLCLQTLVMFLTPTALSSRSWETYSLYLDAAVMAGVIVFAVAMLRGEGRSDRSLLRYLGVFIVANTLMMAAFLLWFVSGETLPLALSLVAETAIYFDAVYTGAGFGGAFQLGGPTGAAPAVIGPDGEACEGVAAHRVARRAEALPGGRVPSLAPSGLSDKGAVGHQRQPGEELHAESHPHGIGVAQGVVQYARLHREELDDAEQNQDRPDHDRNDPSPHRAFRSRRRPWSFHGDPSGDPGYHY